MNVRDETIGRTLGLRRLLVAAGLVCISCGQMPWLGKRAFGRQLKCGMGPEEVESLARQRGVDFEYGGTCKWSSVSHNGGVILMAFDGVPKLVFAAHAGKMVPFEEVHFEWVVACQEQIKGCLEGAIPREPPVRP